MITLHYTELVAIGATAKRRMSNLEKIYRGRRYEHGTVVTVDGQPLPLRLDLRNHSPTGFEWGYWGSGPAQLALAMLADCLGNDERALRLYQRFKFKVIGTLRQAGWHMSAAEVRKAVLPEKPSL